MKHLLPLMLCLFLASCNKEENLIKQIESETKWNFEKVEEDSLDKLNVYSHTVISSSEVSKKTLRIKEIIDKNFGSLGEQTADGEFSEIFVSSRYEWKWENLKTEIRYRYYFQRTIDDENKYQYKMLIYYRDKK